ncbi:class I SAM-dependent methyltransferase [Streptomyces brasiliensis]|uniref:Methyltransferase n=1 Tax=Streptomyces brasiliensis TaxID=1954 RepID=A0A917L9L9_9ACTN|nr:class I SAM-dependent methyltransferase [Streptomyces brasiliensis]GGJ54873.1 methyltransferase [Streptomyces brasiliensis]
MTAIANPRQAQAWNGSVGLHWAAHTARYDRLISGVDEALFGAADIAAGDRVLDVGCGAGATTRSAARLAKDGHVVGVDISAPLLERARESTVAEGIANAAYELAEAQLHPFPDAGYDNVISRGGVMFFADHAEAFRNLWRALRPGGRLTFICPQPSGPQWEESRALYLFSQLVNGPDESGDSDTVVATTAMASLSDPDRIREVLDGYDDVTVTPVTIETEWGRDARDAVDFLLSRSPDTVVGPQKRAELEDALRPYTRPNGVRMRAGVWLVSAVRP